MTNRKVMVFIKNYSTNDGFLTYEHDRVFEENKMKYKYEGSQIVQGTSYYDKVIMQKYIIDEESLDRLEKAFREIGITVYYRTV